MRIYLENILHPKVFERIDEIIKNIPTHGEPSIVLIEAPLIFERGYQNRFDVIITVYTPEETALERLEKKGMSKEEAKKRLKTQFPIEMKKSKSDYIIDNSGTVEETKVQVEKYFRNLSHWRENMQVIKEIKKIDYPEPVITIGNFDGVHIGHQKIFDYIKRKAKQIQGASVVITFNPHPIKVLYKEHPLKFNNNK